MVASEADVAVIGGGVIGTACAWRLARHGLRVVLLDPAAGSGASGAAAGMLAPVSEVQPGEGALLRLSLAAAAAYPEFVADVTGDAEQDVAYRACGTLQVALTADDARRLADLRELQLDRGLDVVALTGRECRRLESLLDPGVAGGTLAPGDHQVEPRRLLRALQRAAARRGVRVSNRSATVGVQQGAVTGAVLEDGTTVAARRVVLASGAWAREHAPVRPVKGQILRLRMPAGEHVLQRTVRGRVRDREIYLVPRTDGELVLGATTEEAGFDLAVTAGAVHDLLHDAQSLLPAVSELALVETLARPRPGTPNNLPVVGPAEIEGLVLAVGHHRNGVLLADATARAVVDMVAGAGLPADFAPCAPRREEMLAWS